MNLRGSGIIIDDDANTRARLRQITPKFDQFPRGKPHIIRTHVHDGIRAAFLSKLRFLYGFVCVYPGATGDGNRWLASGLCYKRFD